MPATSPSFYRAPWWLPGGHLQTLEPALAGSRRDPGYRRERLELPDGDFVDLDWLASGSANLGLLIHGLEGSARSPYIIAMARALWTADPGRDVLALNLRGCSGEPNRTRRFYHSGETEDLRSVIAHVAERYDKIALVGFSLGGNITLKYLGEAPDQVHQRIKAAVAFSVPCHLASSASVLARPLNRIYMKRFLRTLVAKIRHYAREHPGSIDLSGIDSMRTFREFDGCYTGPLHGFRDADDYWTRCSSRQFLPAIRVPTLLVNARNDPFLSPECFPEGEDAVNPALRLEFPDTGGHVGFPGKEPDDRGWKENRAIQFLETLD
ncbi:MAG: alpha/beta fold hydrolase [Opitutaceae bacterium]